jgi:hypothetical protein
LHDPKRATYITETHKNGIKRKGKHQNNNLKKQNLNVNNAHEIPNRKKPNCQNLTNNLIKYKNFNNPIEVASEKHETEQRNREMHTNLLKKKKKLLNSKEELDTELENNT